MSNISSTQIHKSKTKVSSGPETIVLPGRSGVNGIPHVKSQLNKSMKNYGGAQEHLNLSGSLNS
jgi:hypothetical protein